MAEASPYPGSPSLSPEAREKVRQTFRHTIQLAKSGRNEEALLGCDFILKMDARFQPARRLLETLRGVATGTIVDLTPFAEWVDGAGSSASMPAMPAMPSPGVAPASPPAPLPRRPSSPTMPKFVPPASAPLPAPSAPASSASLDDLAFDDFALGAPPAAPAPAPAPRPAPPRAAPPAALDFSPDLDDEPGLTAAVSPMSPPFQPAPMAPAPLPPSPPPDQPSGAVDPRIGQFLKQGDEAMNRGQVQEAIDLWSRVFLIDLANEEASQRIDAARERQAETGRKIDILLSEGISQYDAGDLAAARAKFLDVLALSENDSTARNYLNQIDASLAEKNAVTLGGSSDFMKSELEAPSIPSFAPPEESFGSDFASDGIVPIGASLGTQFDEETPRAAPRRKIKVRLDPRLLGAIGLVVVAVLAYLLLGRRTPTPTPTPEPRAARPPSEEGAPPAAPKEDTIAKAKLLIEGGKAAEAEAILLAVPPTDPNYGDALRLLDTLKSAPRSAAANSAGSAAMDEARIAGLAAARSSHYIDAVKALDPVVKSRPDDAEAAQVLAKARERVAAMGSAVKAYNEQDFTTAIRLLWDLRKSDTKNQDVEEFLFKAYFNEGIMELQAGNSQKASDSLKEAVGLRPTDAEAQRHLKFVKRYSKGATDLLSRIYIKHLTPRS